MLVSLANSFLAVSVAEATCARTVYTPGMKTAVSIPDDVFAGAERLAHRTKRSRSHIYSAAVREYVARHSGDAVTEAMNSALERVGVPDASDEFVSVAARSTLERVEW